jgi:hypothetical protein
MSRPSLRITHFEDRAAPADFAFEVWNPRSAAYEPLAGLDLALERVGRLAQEIHEMWVAKDPALAAMQDPPDIADGSEFAELRVSAQANRHYDVRSFDNKAWHHFTGYISQAAAHICGEVGYASPVLAAPEQPPLRRQSRTAS